jgi:hypothetical protein
MDYNEFEEQNTVGIDTDIKYSDDIEFLVTELNGMAHMGGRYDRGVQLRKAFYILKTLKESGALKNEK